jgi:hypothetical protein
MRRAHIRTNEGKEFHLKIMRKIEEQDGEGVNVGGSGRSFSSIIETLVMTSGGRRGGSEKKMKKKCSKN